MSGVVGRPVELCGVADFLDAASQDVSGLILEGDPGIGKTTLWLDALARARERGFEVLSARVGVTEVSLTFAALADLLDGVDPAVLGDLPPPQRTALQRVLDRTESAPATNEHLVGAAFLGTLGRLSAQRPLLLAVDDAQWLDASIRTVLAFAVRRMTGRIGVLGTVRLHSGRADATAWLQLAKPDTMTRMRVTGLSADTLHAVLSARTGRSLSRPEMMRIAQTSGGNPFYALELARIVDELPAVDAALPNTLSAVIDERIGRLTNGVDDMLLIASAAAAPTVALIATAGELTKQQVAASLDDAETHGVVAFDGDRRADRARYRAWWRRTGAPTAPRRTAVPGRCRARGPS